MTRIPAIATFGTCRQIDAAGVALCIAIAVGTYFGGVRPAMRRRASLDSQRSELAGRRQRVAELTGTNAEFTKELDRTRGALAAGKIILESPRSANRRVGQIAKLSSECGLDVDDIRLGERVVGFRCLLVPVELAGRGRYPDCAVFFHRLGKEFPDTGVASFEISSRPDNPAESGKFQCELIWHAAPDERRE